MTRLVGDHIAAAGLGTVRTLLSQAVIALRGADYISAMDSLARAEVIFGHAIGDLEAATGVPWGAIAIDPSYEGK